MKKYTIAIYDPSKKESICFHVDDTVIDIYNNETNEYSSQIFISPKDIQYKIPDKLSTI